MSQGSLCGDVSRLTRVMIKLGAEDERKTRTVKTVNVLMGVGVPTNELTGGINHRPQCRLQGSYDEAGVDVVFLSHVHVGLQLHAGVVVCKHRKIQSVDVSRIFSIVLCQNECRHYCTTQQDPTTQHVEKLTGQRLGVSVLVDVERVLSHRH